MKKELSPAQITIALVIAVMIAVGVGYWLTFGSTKSYKSLPKANSRGEMLQNMQRGGLTKTHKNSVPENTR